ncbi:hypothetical protein LJC60_05635 [Ruminococcaceae bacterium OttesenSCG-928-D13]|nr:hypothetical protein [Ruminococcaceae bacterium OttesenSCG-928-D13]
MMDFDVQRENEAMRRALRELHAKANGLPRKAHTGYIPISARIADCRVKQGTKDLKLAYSVTYESAYPATTYPMTALLPRIEQELSALAAASEYEGDTPPRLWEIRLSVQYSKGDNWTVQAIFDKQFNTIYRKEVHND